MTLQAIFLLPASENCQKPSRPRCRGAPLWVHILYVWVSVVHAFTKDTLTILIMEQNFSRIFKMAWDEITGSAEKTTRIGVNAF